VAVRRHLQLVVVCVRHRRCSSGAGSLLIVKKIVSRAKKKNVPGARDTSASRCFVETRKVRTASNGES
jgi:hypothetical protein